MNMLNSPRAIEIHRLNTAEVLALFQTLPAPEFTEMHGEYAAALLRHPHPLLDLLSKYTLAKSPLDGRWLCKAFRPVNASEGRGYNTFERFGRVRQDYPMMTLMAPSRYDGKPAYQLVYRAYGSLFGYVNMVDEIRRLEDGLYLGIGTWGLTYNMRQLAYPFLLSGPVHPYRGDIGSRRSGLVLTHAIPALVNRP